MHLVSKKKKKLKITGQVYSSCGKFFATIENNKKLSVYNVSKPSVDKYKLTKDIGINDRLYLSANAKYLCARRGKPTRSFMVILVRLSIQEQKEISITTITKQIMVVLCGTASPTMT